MTDRPDYLREDASEDALSPEVEAALGEALRAAFAPTDIDPQRHEQLLQSCLEDPFAEPTAEELIESARLREALERGTDHPEAQLARTLQAAVKPAPATRAELERAQVGLLHKKNVIYVAFGGGALLAAAAGVLLLLTQPKPSGPVYAEAPHVADALAESRSTTALFDEPFVPGKTTSRVDRILAVREKELRENRYARWGVR